MEFAAGHLGSDVVQLLLDHGSHGSDEISSLLVHACEGLNAEVVRLLLGKSVGNHGLNLALKASLRLITSVKEEVGRSISSYADVMLNEKGNITCVAREIRASVVDMLLDAGADICAVGEEFEAALLASSIKGDIDFVKLLVQRDADFCHRSSSCKHGIAINAARISGHLDMVAVLERACQPSVTGNQEPQHRVTEQLSVHRPND